MRAATFPLLLAAFLILGCGGKVTGNPSQPPPSNPPTNPPPPPPVTQGTSITWKTDGNPLVPACGTAATNCKFGYTALDKTTGAVVQLPITATGYAAPTTDDYWILVDGFDGDGNSLQSTCCEVEPMTTAVLTGTKVN